MFGRFQQSLFKGIGKAIPKSVTCKTTNKGLFWGLKSQSRSINVENRIKELGYTLPPAVNPAANYVGAVRRENFIYLSGHLPYKAPNFYSEKDLIKGKVGKDVSVEQAYEAARSCALALLGTLEREVDDLDSVQIVKVTGYINCTENFTDHSQVMNGASDFLVQVFGESRGSHTRSAVGVNSLPKGVAVEIEMIAYALEEYVNNKVD